MGNKNNLVRKVTFFPGPSQVYEEVGSWMVDAQNEGVLSMSHRSPEFVTLMRKTVSLLKSKINIPQNYTIFFTSSATECWQIIAQSFVTKSYHFHNGSFGQRWYQYTSNIVSDCVSIDFDHTKSILPEEYIFKDGNLIAITQNETSNGTQVSDTIIGIIKKNHPNHLLAVDVTSSLGGISLPFGKADIWFGSVQKCFGLPAGLGILICSPKALTLAKTINNNKYYNSAVYLNEMAGKGQTTYTPNVLGIYLLMRSLDAHCGIEKVDLEIRLRQKEWVQFFAKSKKLQMLITNTEVASCTVLPIRGNIDLIAKVKQEAKEVGLILGEGYGKWNKDTFRIANFPAIQRTDNNRLKEYLSKYL